MLLCIICIMYRNSAVSYSCIGNWSKNNSYFDYYTDVCRIRVAYCNSNIYNANIYMNVYENNMLRQCEPSRCRLQFLHYCWLYWNRYGAIQMYLMLNLYQASFIRCFIWWCIKSIIYWVNVISCVYGWSLVIVIKDHGILFLSIHILNHHAYTGQRVKFLYNHISCEWYT